MEAAKQLSVRAAEDGTGYLVIADDGTISIRVPEPADGTGRAEDEAATARVEAAFLRSVAHDLANPIAVITGMAYTLCERDADLSSDVRLELAEAIGRQGGRLLSALENLLALDRLALGRTRLRRQWTDVAGVLLDVAIALRDERVDVRTHLQPIMAVVDPTLVERMVENLIRNAAEHQLTEHAVEVRLQFADHDPGWFEIRVLDRGPGISPEERSDIFQPYFSGDRRGVGLSIVRAFARMHGGDVDVEDRPGGGSIFVVSLPLDGDEVA